MKAQHTPGPWHVRLRNGPGGITAEVCFGDDEVIADGVYEMADARLIAAAPDLLEALLLLAGCIVMRGDPYEGLGPSKPGTSPIAKARAAIAKAKGEAP